MPFVWARAPLICKNSILNTQYMEIPMPTVLHAQTKPRHLFSRNTMTFVLIYAELPLQGQCEGSSTAWRQWHDGLKVPRLEHAHAKQ
jgi:hypothetical protein